MRCARAWAIVLIAGQLLCSGIPACLALARPADAGAAVSAPRRAPGGPALASDSGAAGASEGQSFYGGEGEADPLVNNGLGSPLCKGALGGDLSAGSRRDCETSGFVAAPSPTGDYGIDVHIDTGLPVVSSGWLLSVVQDLFVQPVWMAIVWAVHALIVMVEWCYTIDLLDSASAVGLGRGLREMQSTITAPWLASVLAIAAVASAYKGLVRRRVAETVGEALLMLAMMTAGLWVIADPIGTIGALGRWANEASLGTLSVAAHGSPVGAGRGLADSAGVLFAATIQSPWCYLEFGDVGWCRDSARLDPRLRRAGVEIASGEEKLLGCHTQLEGAAVCVSPASTEGSALRHSAELLRAAPNNGAIFLALAPNSPPRNSINEQGSLLRVLCDSSDATACHGPTAAEAQFRTAGETWARVGGLLLIVAGVLGMLLVLGFIVLRLLAAALFSLLYLLLAPAAVLAPALGDAGRAAFRGWGARLLAAVVSKLLYSFLLGAVLAVVAVLDDLTALGWWTQWLLTAAFWWGAFARRHQALAVAEGAVGRERRERPRSVVRRVSDVLDRGAAARRLVTRVKDGARSDTERPRASGGPGANGTPGEPATPAELAARRSSIASGQVDRLIGHERAAAARLLGDAPRIRMSVAEMSARLQRVRTGREHARARGETRRDVSLALREGRLEREIALAEGQLERTSTAAAGDRSRAGRAGERSEEAEREQRARWLSAQARLPAGGGADEAGARRDYERLAGLAGYGPREYAGLDPGARRAARLQIDRELSLRRGLAASGGGTRRDADRPGSSPRPPDGGVAPGVGGPSAANRGPAGGRSDRVPAAGAPRLADLTRTRPADGRAAGERVKAPGERPRAPRRGSPVLDDAREVAAGRKRQLGRDRS